MTLAELLRQVLLWGAPESMTDGTGDGLVQARDLLGMEVEVNGEVIARVVGNFLDGRIEIMTHEKPPA